MTRVMFETEPIAWVIWKTTFDDEGRIDRAVPVGKVVRTSAEKPYRAFSTRGQVVGEYASRPTAKAALRRLTLKGEATN